MPLEANPDRTKPGLSTDQINDWLKKGQGGYTVEQLTAAFDQVKNPEHWKNEIKTIVDRDQMDILTKAIPWFTGTPAEFTEVPGQPDKISVWAAGYFAGPCN